MTSSQIPISTPYDAHAIVSSFYGPGTLAAWCIILISSWIPLLRDDYKNNYHFVGAALYTNWAAIDIFREFHWRTKMGRDSLWQQQIEGVDVHATAIAAKAVVAVGAFHGFIQYAACRWKLSKAQDVDSGKSIRKRCLLVLLTQVLPALGIWFSPSSYDVFKPGVEYEHRASYSSVWLAPTNMVLIIGAASEGFVLLYTKEASLDIMVATSDPPLRFFYAVLINLFVGKQI